jgi:ABC-type phosphate transport system substrate-binding protein
MRAFFLLLLIAVMAIVLDAGVVHADKPPPPPYLVIVNTANPTIRASRGFVSDAFLKKTTRWPNDDVIRPVDQAEDSAVRRRFSEDVLRRSVAAVKSYWQQIVFTGRDLPPPELGSDDEVVTFVTKHPGAIGYVAGDARIVGVKILLVE